MRTTMVFPCHISSDIELFKMHDLGVKPTLTLSYMTMKILHTLFYHNREHVRFRE